METETIETTEDIFGPVISSYSRAQAIEDGVLVDLMQEETSATVREAGFVFPIAMTATAFGASICPIGGELPAGQDLQGRLWDMLMMLKFTIQNNRGDRERLPFSVKVSGRMVGLVSVCGPGDHAEPVITIMMPDED